MFAIVGVATQLPAGLHSTTDLGYDEFWDFLLKGGEATENLSELSLDPNPFKLADLSKLPQKGSFLKNIAEFDYSSFGISSADARVMPNSARRLIELSFYALRDAGVQTRGQAIGCFMSGNNDLDGDAMNTDGSLAYIPSAIANRISYTFNLTGPSVAVDTACSSSLTGLHLAISAIKNGDCRTALVGAAQSNRKITEWWRYDKAQVLSSDGVCKPFDDRADGFSRGEGAIVVVVKALQDALRDNDCIYCTVAGSFHAAAGSDLPVYVPNGKTQQTCISQAYTRAGKRPMEADYVELHITGTSVGDPIEANAAGEIFCHEKSNIKVGSVKGNIGHLECAAFLASLVKACHIFEKGIIPPTPNFAVPNRSILWDDFNFEVVTEPIPLGCKTGGKRPLISIASAGIGGSTGHVLLEGPPEQTSDAVVVPPQPGTPVLFLVGGLTPNSVYSIAHQLQKLPEDHASLLKNAVIASRQTRQTPWRSFLIYKNRDSLSAEIPRPILASAKVPRLAFIFSGQGPHNAQMGHQLFQQYPIFRDTVLKLDDVHKDVMGYSFLEVTGLFTRDIRDPRVLHRKWPVILTLPALIMVHLGLFEVLRSMGVKPDCLLGHSAGETALVYASGAGPMAMTMEIALARGRSMTCTEPMDGAMAVVSCNATDCQVLIDRVHLDQGIEKPDVEISCFNAPESVVVSGKRIFVETVIAHAREQGIFAQAVHTLVPGHCKYIEYCREEHYKLMEDIFTRYAGPHVPTLPVYSTCRPNTMVEEFTPDYFWDNARNPVYFSDATSRVLADNAPGTMFVEISPHPVLSGIVADHGAPPGRIVCPMQRLSRGDYDPHHESICLLSSVAELALAGYDHLDFTRFYGLPRDRKSVFHHPLQRLKVPPFKTFPVAATKTNRPLYSSLPSLDPVVVSLVSQHRVSNVPVIPGTGWLELVLETGARYLWDVEYQSLLALHQDRHLALRFERHGRNRWSITSSQQAKGQSAPSRVVIATGCLGTNPSHVRRSEPLDISGLQAKLRTLPLQGLHDGFGDHFFYGPSFKRLLALYGNASEVLAEIRGLNDEERSLGFILHPAVIDACTRIVAFKEILQDWETCQWFPKHSGRFILHSTADGSTSWFSFARLKRWTPDSRVYDIVVTDDQGHPICEWKSSRFQKVSIENASGPRSALSLSVEPFRIPSTFSPDSGFFPNQEANAYNQLYRALDYLALKRFQETLGRQSACAAAVNRVRYLERMRDLLENQNRFEIVGEQELREQGKRWPAFFEVTKRLGDVHESLLQSSQTAVNVLFSDDLMSRYYAEHNQLTKACEEMAQRLDKILHFLRDSGRYTVSILEVGAGTGTLTRHLIPTVISHDQLVVDYTVTDVSYSLVADLARSQNYERLIPQAYDVTKDPHAQGLSPESFDIIIAYHVLHVVPDLNILTRQLQGMLVPGGLLLVTEIDNTSWFNKPGAPWMDFAFGSFAEWFNYQDGRTHCSMSPSQWEGLLESSGFGNFSSIVGSGHCLDFTFSCQKVISGKVEEQPPNVTLFHFKAGEEQQLQQRLGTFNPDSEGILCLWTDSKYDADTALGLVITLAKEFPSQTIWLAMFESCIQPDQAASFVKSNHRQLAKERTVHFSVDGTPFFPRVVRLAPFLEGELLETASSVLPADHLRIRVVERNMEGGFIGQVIQSEDPQIPVDSFVGGLTASLPTQNPLTIHAGSIARVAKLDTRTLLYLSAILLQYHALGPSRSIYLARSHSPLRILLSLRNAELAKALKNLLDHSCGVCVLTETTDDFVDVLVTDHHSLDVDPFLEQSVGTDGRLVVWSPELVEETLSKESWILRHMLDVGLRNLGLSPVDDRSQPNGHISAPLVGQAEHGSFLDRNKTYILIGGIGGIGLHLAIWLYKASYVPQELQRFSHLLHSQNGARHIYLTSRRGREAVSQTGDVFLSLKLQYLESLSDLDLKLVACDALNPKQVDAFLKMVDHPIAGCFLMPLVLHDALFLRQSHETIEAVRQSKVGALDVFSSLYDIKAMDFFVAFSSVTALWGNPGQSNYASSCAALGGKMSEYPNAFAILVPAILDAGYLTQTGVLDHLNIQGSHKWGIGVEELCEYIRDGIVRVKAGASPSILIPALNLSIVAQHIFLPPLYRSLVPLTSSGATKGRVEAVQPEVSNDEAHASLMSVLELVMVGLGIENMAAFAPDIPFINLGLDSIRATRLSRQLRPYVKVTQTDLLVGMTWNDLEVKIKAKRHQRGTRSQSSNVAAACKDLVLSALGVDSPSNFYPEVPFINSGLDSIRATQLSRKLRPYVRVTQTDLLVGMCWRDLEAKILQGDTQSVPSPPSTSLYQRRPTHALGLQAIEDARALVIESLGIEPANFDPDIPFINFGLDSIRATRLSRKLRPFVQVTQMDLLLGMAWRGLEEKIRSNVVTEVFESVSSPAIPVQEQQKLWSVSWEKLGDASADKPVILGLPGITGNLASISPLMNHFSKGSATFWAVYVDLATSHEFPPSLQQLADEIVGGINQRHPSGPLRFVAVSGSSMLVCLLTKTLEASGRTVTDVSFVDHFPVLFCHNSYGLQSYMVSREETPETTRAMENVIEKGVDIMLRMQEIDSAVSIQQTGQDEPDRLQGVKYLKTARLMTTISIQFMKDLYYRLRTMPSEAYEVTLMKWLASVKAPFMVAIADKGFNLVVEVPWADMGAGKLMAFKSNVEVLHLDRGHFSIVGCEALAKKLYL